MSDCDTVADRLRAEGVAPPTAEQLAVLDAMWAAMWAAGRY
jgi:hypothetical protein